MLSEIRRITIEATGATGGAGAATASATSSTVITGQVIGVYLEYLDSPPAGVDTTIQEANVDPATMILTETNYNTDGWVYPVHAVVDSTGGTVTDGYQEIYVADYVSVSIAEANDGDGVRATIVWKTLR